MEQKRRKRRFLEHAGDMLTEILYPRRCPVCHDIVMPKGQKICLSCRKKLIPAEGPRCFCCSKPLKTEEQEYCRACSHRSRLFDKGIGIFPYNSILQESLFKLKYEKRQEYGVFYGEIAAFYTWEKIREWKIELVVPVPLHKKRMQKRGYNQAQIISEAFGVKLALPVDSKLLKRTVNTKPQKDLSPKERKKNLENAFLAAKEAKGKRILLIDDIYTTGATVEACALALKKAGAAEVYFLSIAIGTDI